MTTTTRERVATRPWIGRALPRLEDRRFILGQGEYADDLPHTPGTLYAAVVRSPFAHARIRSIDGTAAMAATGVVAVFTGRDYAADGRLPIAHRPVGEDNVDATKRAFDGAFGDRVVREVAQQVLPAETVMHQGEGVALVIADSLAHALDAVELVDVSYDDLPVVVAIDQALAPDAPQLIPDLPGNVSLDATRGDVAATDRAFDAAHAIVSATFHTPRIYSAHMEPRSASSTYDAETQTFHLTCGGGGAVRFRRLLSSALNVPIENVHVRTPDVGGSFGSRNGLHPEAALVAWAAYKLGRPVRWIGTRSDGFLTDFQGRDIESEAALALDADGRILALRTTATANVGASTIAYSFMNNYSRIAVSVYDIPAVTLRVRGVITNTTPVSSFRGAGRPEAMFVIERLLDIAAKRMVMSRREIRRRNLIKKTPYVTATGLTYDSGDFIGNMEKALALGDYDTFPARRRESEARGKLRGISVANYMESPVGYVHERAVVSVLPEGVVEVLIGTQSSGQGHETTFPQIVADYLGVPIRSVRIVTGDTERIDVGGGSHSDRSMRLGSTLLVQACTEIMDAARAASGTSTPDLFALAATTPLSARADIHHRLPAYPTGAAVCEVEVDPATGQVELVAYAQVDDAGRAINPLILHGQAHGGIAQGLGQALGEAMVFDRETGQVLSGSFMGYAVPRARHMPPLKVELTEDRTLGNVLNVKGGGEGGIMPSPAAAVGAVIDALHEYEVEHIEQPVTAAKVWRVTAQGKKAAHA
ncbi:MAG TPA: xanthine dehydrogenase family protein molybdopterin-binding subunit [Candidatus Lustribacter sp.]